jgi:hypothetical protein
MQQYRIEGNHPIGRYITWTADGLADLNQKVKELEDHGYEVTVTPGVKPEVKDEHLRNKGLQKM